MKVKFEDVDKKYVLGEYEHIRYNILNDISELKDRLEDYLADYESFGDESNLDEVKNVYNWCFDNLEKCFISLNDAGRKLVSSRVYLLTK